MCQGAGGSESSRSPPPTSTTEQKTRPPPLHTRYPLVSTSIEDLFYRSLASNAFSRARARARSFARVPCGGRALFQADLWVRPFLYRAPACSRAATIGLDPLARGRRDECKVRGSSRGYIPISSLAASSG